MKELRFLKNNLNYLINSNNENSFKIFDVRCETMDYFVKNKSKGYCRMLIQPKLEKFKKVFRKDSR